MTYMLIRMIYGVNMEDVLKRVVKQSKTKASFRISRYSTLARTKTDEHEGCAAGWAWHYVFRGERGAWLRMRLEWLGHWDDPGQRWRGKDRKA